jgi:hypothetical protein
MLPVNPNPVKPENGHQGTKTQRKTVYDNLTSSLGALVAKIFG